MALLPWRRAPAALGVVAVVLSFLHGAAGEEQDSPASVLKKQLKELEAALLRLKSEKATDLELEFVEDDITKVKHKLAIADLAQPDEADKPEERAGQGDDDDDDDDDDSEPTTTEVADEVTTSGSTRSHHKAGSSHGKTSKHNHEAKKTSTTKTRTTNTRTTTSTSSRTSTSTSSTTKTTTTKTTTSTTRTTTTTSTSSTTTSSTTTRHHVWGGGSTKSAFEGWLSKLRSKYQFSSPCGAVMCVVPAVSDTLLPEALHGVRSKVVLDLEDGGRHKVLSEGMGYALMLEGIEASRGSKKALENALGLARGWLAMVYGPKERPHPLGGGGADTSDPATKCSIGPYGVSAVTRGESASGLPTWKWPLNLCEGGCEGSSTPADQDAILGLMHTASALNYPADFVDMVVRAVVAFASADLGFPDLYRTLPDGTKVFVPKGGSSWGGLLPDKGDFRSTREPWCYSPGHFAPAHYRTFRDFVSSVWTGEYTKYLPAYLDGTPTALKDLIAAFDGAVLAGYNILYHSSCSSGAVANWVGVKAACPHNSSLNCAGVPWQHTPYVGDGEGTCSASENEWGSYGADASPAIWRVAMDFAIFREESAQVTIYDRSGAEDSSAEFSAQLYLNRIADQYVRHSACDGGSAGQCVEGPDDLPWKLAYAFEPRTRAPNVTCANVPNNPSTWWSPSMAFPSFTAFVAPFPDIVPEASASWMDTISSMCDFGQDEPKGHFCSDGVFEVSQAAVSTSVMAKRLQKLSGMHGGRPSHHKVDDVKVEQLLDDIGVARISKKLDASREFEMMDGSKLPATWSGKLPQQRTERISGTPALAFVALAAVAALAALPRLARTAPPGARMPEQLERSERLLGTLEAREGSESESARHDRVPASRMSPSRDSLESALLS